THRNANGFGHRAASPVCRLVRRLRAGERHHPCRGFRRDRRLARLTSLVAQYTFNPALGKALLPPPYRRPADADALRHPLRRMPIRRGEHDARSLDVFTQPVAVARNRRQLLALRGAQYHAYLLRHGPRPPTPWPSIAYRDA